MLYEKLKNLLSEWDLYTSKEAEIPERIMKLEKWSIAKSVEITIAEMRSNNELEKILEEDKEKIEIIFNYLSIMASTKSMMIFWSAARLLPKARRNPCG